MPEEYLLELIKARVTPADEPFDEGIHLAAGKTLPFIVERGWSGPSGYYNEAWSIRKGGAEILYESEAKPIYVRGFQSITTYKDRVDVPIALEEGDYRLVFIAEGRFMGEANIKVTTKEKAPAPAQL